MPQGFDINAYHIFYFRIFCLWKFDNWDICRVNVVLQLQLFLFKGWYEVFIKMIAKTIVTALGKTSTHLKLKRFFITSGSSTAVTAEPNILSMCTQASSAGISGSGRRSCLHLSIFLFLFFTINEVPFQWCISTCFCSH